MIFRNGKNSGIKGVIKSSLAVPAVLLTIGLLMAGCTKAENKDNAPSRNESSVAAESSAVDEKTSSAADEASEPAAESSAPESSEESVEPEPVQESSSVEEESSAPEESSQAAEESSEVSEVSIEAYHFDDEDIVTDYHTATEFTSDEEFNHVFVDNAYDKSYDVLLRDASSGSEMRQITAEYSQKWKIMAENVYLSLAEKLNDNETEKQKLEDSQTNWKNSLEEVENRFYEEAKEGGSDGILAAEGAILNYYKGRAAVLLEQIYVLQNGSIELSDFGL